MLRESAVGRKSFIKHKTQRSSRCANSHGVQPLLAALFVCQSRIIEAKTESKQISDTTANIWSATTHPLHCLVMNRGVHFLLLVLGLTFIPIAHADSLNDELNQHYKNQVLALRSPFVHGDQKFDSAGHALSSPSGDWLVYGGILVRDLSLSPNELRLEGPRVALTQTPGNEKPSAIPLGRDLKVKIRLDSPLNSIEEAQALLNRVFFLDQDDILLAKPEYRRAGGDVDGPIYKAGKGKDNVKPPKATYTPEPDYTDEARSSRFQGVVVLAILIDKNGQVCKIRIERPLGKGLDEEAVKSVKTWRFKPATKDGEPVAAEMNIEVSFNL